MNCISKSVKLNCNHSGAVTGTFMWDGQTFCSECCDHRGAVQHDNDGIPTCTRCWCIVSRYTNRVSEYTNFSQHQKRSEKEKKSEKPKRCGIKIILTKPDGKVGRASYKIPKYEYDRCLKLPRLRTPKEMKNRERQMQIKEFRKNCPHNVVVKAYMHRGEPHCLRCWEKVTPEPRHGELQFYTANQPKFSRTPVPPGYYSYSN